MANKIRKHARPAMAVRRRPPARNWDIRIREADKAIKQDTSVFKKALHVKA